MEITLEWGDSPALGQKRTASARIAHTVSLTRLKPGATYHARFTSRENRSNRTARFPSGAFEPRLCMTSIR